MFDLFHGKYQRACVPNIG